MASLFSDAFCVSFFFVFEELLGVRVQNEIETRKSVCWRVCVSVCTNATVCIFLCMIVFLAVWLRNNVRAICRYTHSVLEIEKENEQIWPTFVGVPLLF